MNRKINIKKISIILIAFYLIAGTLFYFIGGEQLHIGKSNSSLSYQVVDSPVGEILSNTKIEQDFSVNADIINKISLKVATYARINKGNLFVNLIDKQSGSTLFNQVIDVSNLKDNSDFFLNIENKINGVKGKELALIITSDISDRNNSVTLYTAKDTNNFPLYINGKLNQNNLSFSVECGEKLWFGEYYWFIFAAGFLLLIAYMINLILKQKNKKQSLGLNIITAFVKYEFLLHQLVERDFKTKYKRSVLGILWSFFNPLLTMLVQYIVFSTVFKSDIPNFPVYLLSGVVVFNFFSEACGMGLMSIIGNASLITKVYVPKYIYPISRVFSSVINLLLSLIPLLFVMLITGTKITFSILLMPFGLICTLLFCIGMAFILSSAMVFFRDTQFLWNVVSLLWMYATPLFYPETIIPDKFGFILKINPMYHFIRFVRITILQGVSPEPMSYLYCMVFSLGTLFIGALVFKKTQDKFVLNL
ncbi:ABC transporter permease [Clostridium beijerinckii]|uniref:ABC transporter permease n=1 Tax=Clostridium beijerinckii TaxID=1520 RepID=UPI0022E11B79|nr:ABC transporter permease [Clostridium beijerinckii]